MKEFMSEDFILNNDTAKQLYHDLAAGLPIIDYHCHINPKEICEDKTYENITQMWLYGDHYKWRIMRACGVDEKYITGDGSDYDKFFWFAKSLEKAIGNPIYHWSHLELKKYFGYTGILNSKTALQVWELTGKIIKEKNLSVRTLIEMSNVEVICTTDDPIDSLEYHEKIKEEGKCAYKVFPAWRPDKAVNIEKDEFSSYIDKLSKVSGISVKDVSALKEALKNRMEYFAKRGCRVSDHGLDYVPFCSHNQEEVDEIFKKAMSGGRVSLEESEKYKTYILMFLATEYKRLGWIMQLHYNCQRNINTEMFKKLGPDSGFDCISDGAPSWKITAFLDGVSLQGGLPKTIIYSLNPMDNAVIDSIIGGYMDGKERGKIQHGSAWWFNDHKAGMEEQLTSLAMIGVLGEFVGMLTDSRSFLSYTRHEYFRRILCNLIGGWVENGEYPNDEDTLATIVKGICYDNAKAYFNF